MEFIVDVHEWLETKFIGKYNDNAEKKITHYQSPTLFGKTSTYNVLQIQPKANLTVDTNVGLYSKDEDYKKKFINFFKKSFTKYYDLVLAPEYSVPLSSIEYLADELEHIKCGVMYCLGCEGVQLERLEDFLVVLESKNIVINRIALDACTTNQIVCCLLYLVKLRFWFGSEEYMDRVFAFPQFKTTPMKDPKIEFEAGSLVNGNIIFSFGKPSEEHLLSIICSDVFNYELLSEIKSYLKHNRTIIYHPQLNPQPQNDYFRLMRNIFTNFSAPDSVHILSLNWAKGTQIVGQKQPFINNSWSGLYCLYQEGQLNNYLSIVDKEAKNGLNFAHDHHVIMCYFSSDEHIVDMNIHQLLRTDRPIDVQQTRLIKVNSIETFAENDCAIIQLENLCNEMIDSLFRNDPHFAGFFNCVNCTESSNCGISTMNQFMSLVLNKKLKSEFEIINNGHVTSITAKHYRSEYSRDKVYICKRLICMLNNGYITERFKYGDPSIVFFADKSDNDLCNAVVSIDEYTPIKVRIIYLKSSSKERAEELYDRLTKESSIDADRLIIYYEDEIGIKVFPADEYFSPQITSGELVTGASSILGGAQ